jgi:hypothetical protein
MNRRHFLLLLSAVAVGCTRNPSVSYVHEDSSTTPIELPSVTEPGKTLLRYQFKKGEELHWNVQNTLKMKNIIGGREDNVETSNRALKIWKTLDVDTSGAATFEYQVKDVDMHHAQTGIDDVFYNSRKDETIPPAFINIEGKIGKPLAHIRIDPMGQTTKKALREYDARLSENRIVIPLPDEPVGVGSSWSEAKQIDLPQQNQTVKKIRMRHEFTLEKFHSGLATIKFSTLILTPLTPQEKTQLFEYYSVGTMVLDLQAGHFIRQESTIEEIVVGIQGASDSIRYLSRVTECCCGRRACELCGKAQSNG